LNWSGLCLSSSCNSVSSEHKNECGNQQQGQRYLPSRTICTVRPAIGPQLLPQLILADRLIPCNENRPLAWLRGNHRHAGNRQQNQAAASQ
jgi:hypothetical protein